MWKIAALQTAALVFKFTHIERLNSTILSKESIVSKRAGDSCLDATHFLLVHDWPNGPVKDYADAARMFVQMLGWLQGSYIGWFDG